MSTASASPIHTITTGDDPMEEHVIVESSFSAIINAPLEAVLRGASVCRTRSIRGVRQLTSQRARPRRVMAGTCRSKSK
jgi:hypothetical protein